MGGLWLVEPDPLCGAVGPLQGLSVCLLPGRAHDSVIVQFGVPSVCLKKVLSVLGRSLKDSDAFHVQRGTVGSVTLLSPGTLPCAGSAKDGESCPALSGAPSRGRRASLDCKCRFVTHVRALLPVCPASGNVAPVAFCTS